MDMANSLPFVIFGILIVHFLVTLIMAFLAKKWWGRRGWKIFWIYAIVNLVIGLITGISAGTILLLILVKVFHFRKSQLERYKKEDESCSK